MPIKVKEALTIAEAHNCHLVAGFKGLQRAISYVDSLEQPDMEPWMRPGVFYITTGYAYGSEKETIVKLIQSLHDAKAAAIAIKPRFMAQFPKEALEVAERLRFPVILIPEDLPFIELNYPIMEAIIKSQNSILESTQIRISNYNKQFMDKNLFVDLLTKNINYKEEANYRTAALHWPKPPFQLGILDIEDFISITKEKEEGEIQEIKDTIAALIRQSLEGRGCQVIVLSNNDSFPCIIPAQGDVDKLKSLFYGVEKYLLDKKGYQVTIGISSEGNDYLGFEEIYQEARDAILIARVYHKKQRLVYIEEVQFDRLMKAMGKYQICQDYVSRTLKKLEVYDCENDTQLIPTLEALIEHLGARNNAALSLYLHRNTLTYRIKKIESLTGCDLSDSNQLFEIGIAIKLRHYI